MMAIQRKQINQAAVEQARTEVDGRNHEAPSILGTLIFRLKAFVLQRERGLRNVRGPRRYVRGSGNQKARVLAQSSTRLSSSCSQREIPLTAGKIQNLRIALRAIHGIEVPAGQAFSFWAQIGRPSRQKGNARGRELRQGCLIPTIGGGLCQLSNALYQCALESGFEIVERHAHSQVVPGSAADYGMDATVFWNYVDLRFRSSSAFRIEARLTSDSLVVRFKGTPAERPASKVLPLLRPTPAGHTASSCACCGVLSCFRNEESKPGYSGVGKTAYIVDEYWPEFDRFIGTDKRKGDLIGIPLDGKRLRRPRYQWDTEGFERMRTASVATLMRSLELRNAPAQGASRQRTLLKNDRELAESLSRLLTFDVSHVVVTQSLLPFLWAGGHLAARTFDVLMTRLPVDSLQARLDMAHKQHPESSTLADFRAEEWFIEAEEEALANARRIITPNTEIASMFPDRALLLDWNIPGAADGRTRGRGILFPASTLGRKGAYEMRAAARMLGLELTITGSSLEGSDFWRGIPVRRAGRDPLDGIGLVVLPAYVEDKPRLLLRAIASGIPVIASAACGMGRVDGVVTLPALDAGILAAEISSFLTGQERGAGEAGQFASALCNGESARQLTVPIAGGDYL